MEGGSEADVDKVRSTVMQIRERSSKGDATEAVKLSIFVDSFAWGRRDEPEEPECHINRRAMSHKGTCMAAFARSLSLFVISSLPLSLERLFNLPATILTTPSVMLARLPAKSRRDTYTSLEIRPSSIYYNIKVQLLPMACSSIFCPVRVCAHWPILLPRTHPIEGQRVPNIPLK